MHEAGWSREQAIAFLDAPERAESQDPKALWRRLRLRAGMTVADVGAGTGYFAFPAAEVVGPTGRVYAVDISRELVGLLRERAAERRLGHVVVVRSTPDRIPLPDRCADVVLLANLLHGVSARTVAEAVRILRPGGRLVDVDWKKGRTPWGPPVEHRLSTAEAGRVLRAHGLRTAPPWAFGPYHYAIVGRSPARA
jgi:ubiquinone/menaquinone biosynthesis C-methylase UbiE